MSLFGGSTLIPEWNQGVLTVNTDLGPEGNIMFRYANITVECYEIETMKVHLDFVIAVSTCWETDYDYEHLVYEYN